MTQCALCSLNLTVLLLKEYSSGTLQSYRNLGVTLVVSAPFTYLWICLLCQIESRMSFRSKYCNHLHLICIGSQLGMVLQCTKETKPEKIPWEQTKCSPAANKHSANSTKLQLVWHKSCWSMYNVDVGFLTPSALLYRSVCLELCCLPI